MTAAGDGYWMKNTGHINTPDCSYMDGSKPLSVSIVIPLKNEHESIIPLACEIQSVMDGLEFPWECIWIDDGSTDNSLQELKKIRDGNSCHHFIRFQNNFGQSAAISEGFKHASGRIIATMDADLQSDPKDIPKLLKLLLESGADMVNGVRRNRKDSRTRKFSSRIANGFRNIVTGSRVTDIGCSMRIFKRECVDGIILFKGMHRFLPTLAESNGCKIMETDVNHRQRRYGRPKYGVSNRLWVGILDTLMIRWYCFRRINPQIESKSIEKED